MLLSGTAIAARIEEETHAFIHTHALTPALAVILVGDDAASHAYVARKAAAAERLGIRVEVLQPEHATTDSLVTLVHTLNARSDIDAVLVQLPLPHDIDAHAVIVAIDPTKDVDGFHPKNIAAFTTGHGGHAPVLIGAIERLLNETHKNFHNKTAVIVGKSDVFTAPLAYALENRGLSVSWVKPDEPHVYDETRAGDVLIVAVGQPGIISGEHIKEGAVLIDVGITRLPNGKVVGDVDAATATTRASFLTPTPGGVGPVTVAVAMHTVALLAAEHAHVM